MSDTAVAPAQGIFDDIKLIGPARRLIAALRAKDFEAALREANVIIDQLGFSDLGKVALGTALATKELAIAISGGNRSAILRATSKWQRTSADMVDYLAGLFPETPVKADDGSPALVMRFNPIERTYSLDELDQQFAGMEMAHKVAKASGIEAAPNEGQPVSGNPMIILGLLQLAFSIFKFLRERGGKI